MAIRASGLLGGAFGCIVGGGGALVGCWNSYRQVHGHLDILSAPSWTWLDRVMLVYGIAGVLASSTGWLFFLGTSVGYAMVATGLIALLQAGPFLGWRGSKVWGRDPLPT